MARKVGKRGRFSIHLPTFSLHGKTDVDGKHLVRLVCRPRTFFVAGQQEDLFPREDMGYLLAETGFLRECDCQFQFQLVRRRTELAGEKRTYEYLLALPSAPDGM